MEFRLTQHKRDYDLLCSIKEYLDCGYLIKDGPDKYQYRIRGGAVGPTSTRNQIISIIGSLSVKNKEKFRRFSI